MHLTINGEQKELESGTTIAELLSSLEIKAQRIAVARNGQVIPRTEHATSELKPGDTVEIVRMVGGG